MSHFYGTVRGTAKTTATRRGTKHGGIVTHAASWQGSVRVELQHDDLTGRDVAVVSLEPWHGAGVSRVLYRGPVGE